MKIEKKIVKNSVRFSAAAKSAIATSLGIAAAALTACEESGSVSAPERPDLENPDSESNTSSSSSVVDIPLSHEALSSSAVEALSSAAEPLSSSSFEEPYPPPEAGTIAAPTDEDIYGPNSSSSSEEEAQSSSAEEPLPLAGDPIIVEEESSSSEAEQPSSSSVNTLQACSENDPWCIQVHMCNNEDGCMAASMVSTYERSDIAG